MLVVYRNTNIIINVKREGVFILQTIYKNVCIEQGKEAIIQWNKEAQEDKNNLATFTKPDFRSYAR